MTLIDTENAFLTVEEARAHLDLDPGEDVEKVGVLRAIINRISVLSNTYTGRNLKKRAYSDVMLDGTGIESMFLPNYPVATSPTPTVNADGSRLFGSETDLTFWDQTGSSINTNFTVRFETGELIRLDDYWPSATLSVKVGYTAGYDAADVPDIIGAQLVEVADWYNRIGANPQLSQLSAAGISNVFVAGTGPFSGKFAALNPKTRLVLDAYKIPEYLQ